MMIKKQTSGKTKGNVRVSHPKEGKKKETQRSYLHAGNEFVDGRRSRLSGVWGKVVKKNIAGKKSDEKKNGEDEKGARGRYSQGPSWGVLTSQENLLGLKLGDDEQFWGGRARRLEVRPFTLERVAKSKRGAIHGEGGIRTKLW